jgi:hypothetical protein
MAQSLPPLIRSTNPLHLREGRQRVEGRKGAAFS